MSIFVIAEAGVNHGGNFEDALKLVSAARDSGADAVKFQLFNSRRLWGDERIEHLELSQAQMTDIAAYCKAVGIEFMCTPFGVEEAQFLLPMVKRMKIASGCITRHPLLEAVKGMPVILSTGMATPADIEEALWHLNGDDITLLQCTSSYPCRLEDVNLKAMDTLSDLYGHPVGLSDHTSGIAVAIAAAARGAAVIEKHLTLDTHAAGPDHKASIMPTEFKAMVGAIRDVEKALGNGQKRVLPCEEELRKAWRAYS